MVEGSPLTISLRRQLVKAAYLSCYGVGDAGIRMEAYLLRDRGTVYGDAFRQRVKGMGIREVLTAPSCPWQNPFAKRLSASIRRECLEQVLVLSERSLRRMLTATSCTITRRALTFRSTRTHPPDRPLSRRNAARSSRFPKSAACIIATSGAWPEPVSPVRHCRDLPSFRPVAVPQPTLPLFPWWARRTPTTNGSASHDPCLDSPGALWPLVNVMPFGGAWRRTG